MNELDRQLIVTLRDVVRGREGYVYVAPQSPPCTHDATSCFYRDAAGAPSCGIGHVADRLDLPVREGREVQHLAYKWGASEEVADALGAFQEAQDIGVEWGEALERAEEHLGQHGVVIR